MPAVSGASEREHEGDGSKEPTDLVTLRGGPLPLMRTCSYVLDVVSLAWRGSVRWERVPRCHAHHDPTLLQVHGVAYTLAIDE